MNLHIRNLKGVVLGFHPIEVSRLGPFKAQEGLKIKDEYCKKDTKGYFLVELKNGISYEVYGSVCQYDQILRALIKRREKDDRNKGQIQYSYRL